MDRLLMHSLTDFYMHLPVRAIPATMHKQVPLRAEQAFLPRRGHALLRSRERNAPALQEPAHQPGEHPRAQQRNAVPRELLALQRHRRGMYAHDSKSPDLLFSPPSLRTERRAGAR